MSDEASDLDYFGDHVKVGRLFVKSEARSDTVAHFREAVLIPRVAGHLLQKLVASGCSGG